MAASRSARPVWSLVVLAIVLGRVSHAQPAGTRQYRYLMGTSVEVEVFDPAQHAAIDEAFAAMAEVDRLMSNYRDDSELTMINRSAATHAVQASDPMFGVLSAAHDVSARSAGAFDVTVGPLVRLWGFHDKKPHVPTTEELAAVRSLVDYRNVLLDPAQRTVRFTRPGVEIDLGGIAKGFAVEIAADVLRRHGAEGFIDAGGNQYLRGTPPGKRLWSVGVKDPMDPRRVLGAIDADETSVSTSADYANFLTADGRTYGHILDPHTLAPSDSALSVTILSRDGTLADALSKAVFVLGPSAGLDLVASFPGTSALIVYRDRDGKTAMTMTPSLKSRFHPSPAR
ncbi:MAG TPA: FAD:protein FMN transferase [Vicinamibacterales bacterium]